MMQLNPPIPLDTPKGKALAHFVIDYGPEHHLVWVTFIDETGECWSWQNTQVRAQKNITMQRRTREPRSNVSEEPTLLHKPQPPATRGKLVANGSIN